MNVFTRAVLNGDAHRVSKRHTLADGEELIVHFEPVDAGGTIHVETPAISAPKAADIDVYENADPGANLTDDLFVHNMNYGVPADEETPEATVQRVTNGNLTTTSADQTEQTRIQANREYNTPGGESQRAIWRTIPVGETVSVVITDQSGGANNEYGIDTVVYEGAP